MKLYEYLFNLYNSNEEFQCRYTLDRFMNAWVMENMARDTYYEGFINDEFLGYHSRYFEINHEKRFIDFEIIDDEIENRAENKKLSVAVEIAKEQLMEFFDSYNKEEE